MALDPKKNLPKSEKNLKDSPMPPLPFADQAASGKGAEQKRKEIERIAHKEGNLTLDEANVLIKDLEEKGNKMRRQLDELYQLRGSSPATIEKFINDPSNFTPQQWEVLNKKRRELIDSLKFSPTLTEWGEKLYSKQLSQYSSPATKTLKSTVKPKDRKMGGSKAWLASHAVGRDS